MVRIFVCGDITNPFSKTDFVGEGLIEKIRHADFAVCNFEGPELKSGQKTNSPHQEAGTAAYLKSVGFDLMLLANNHIAELGADGIRQTIDAIRATGADCMGAGLSWEEAYRPIIRDIAGLRFGFINICEAQNGYFYSPDQPYGYAWIGYDHLFDDVKKLAEQTDKVIVFVHAGLEHYSIPLPEYRKFYKKLCDVGASCVVGSHPHCPQGYEYYGNSFIAYSLGNFFFPRSNNTYAEENVSFSLILEFDERNSVSVTPVHHYLNNRSVVLLEDDLIKVDVNKLCDLLNDEYKSKAIEMCVNEYNKRIDKRLANCFCGEYNDISLAERIKNNLRYLLFRKKFVINTKQKRLKSLLPLFENESRRYSIVTALKYKYNNKK